MNGSCLVVSAVHSGGACFVFQDSKAGVVPSLPVGVGGRVSAESMSKNGNPWLAFVAKFQSLARGV